nr:heme A synthase [Propionibacterium sp.]
MDRVTSDRALRRWAWASLLANMAIIWTGALVRLTKSGLGCPTWPECQAGSYVPVPEQGVHGLIEFGNRLLTFVLVGVALGMALAARRAVADGRQPRRLLALAVVVGLGIVAQAVVGGVSVLTQLNPWVVGLHMAASVVLILVCVELVHLTHGLPRLEVTAPQRALASAVFWLGMVIVVLGVVVTGAGPNAGDGAATRNGLSLEWTAKVHAWAVWVVVALTALGVWRSAGSARLRRLFVAVLAVEMLQGVIGYVQYFAHLPVALVFAHMVGTTLFVAAVGHLWLSTRRPRPPAVRGGAQKSSGSSAAATATRAR